MPTVDRYEIALETLSMFSITTRSVIGTRGKRDQNFAVAKKPMGSNHLKYDCHHAALKRDYPQCKTLSVNDEQCDHVLHFDGWQYYSSNMPHEAYLPLGPRVDSWKSFQELTQREGNAMFTPSTQQQYVFNAIFSESTYSSRKKLHGIIRSQEGKLFPEFVQIAHQWSPKANIERNDQLDTDDYVQILVDSVFTLAPIGHNPESFLLFEAVEAGSIPVMVFDEHYYNHPCKGSLDAWLNSPIIVINSWDKLYSTLHELMGNPEALEQRQSMLCTWYEVHVRKTVAAFGIFLLDGNIDFAM